MRTAVRDRGCVDVESSLLSPFMFLLRLGGLTLFVFATGCNPLVREFEDGSCQVVSRWSWSSLFLNAPVTGGCALTVDFSPEDDPSLTLTRVVLLPVNSRDSTVFILINQATRRGAPLDLDSIESNNEDASVEVQNYERAYSLMGRGTMTVTGSERTNTSVRLRVAIDAVFFSRDPSFIGTASATGELSVVGDSELTK